MFSFVQIFHLDGGLTGFKFSFLPVPESDSPPPFNSFPSCWTFLVISFFVGGGRRCSCSCEDEDKNIISSNSVTRSFTGLLAFLMMVLLPAWSSSTYLLALLWPSGSLWTGPVFDRLRLWSFIIFCVWHFFSFCSFYLIVNVKKIYLYYPVH